MVEWLRKVISELVQFLVSSIAEFYDEFVRILLISFALYIIIVRSGGNWTHDLTAESIADYNLSTYSSRH